MSAIDVRPLASVPGEPWRNGGGLTRTLATGGDQWRISLAEVERDGPYSRFEGISRISLVMRGGGVALRNAQASVMLKPFEAVEFDGGPAWNASLIDGPVTVLNVMSAWGRYRARVRAIVDRIIVPPNCAAVVVALDSRCSFREEATGRAGHVEPGEVLIVDDVTRPLELNAARALAASGEPPRLAVLVTIEPSRIRIND